MSNSNTNENHRSNSVGEPENTDCPEHPIQPPVEITNQVKHHQHRHSVKSRYEFLQTLGKGTYGKVRLARQRETNQYVAIKSIRKDKVGQLNMTHIRREMEILSQISHPNIIKIYEVFENQDKIVIVMEYASGGELYDFITKHKNLNELQAKHFFSQIVSALRYCHKQGIVHRDLKLENILLDRNGQIKIADFGLSNRFTTTSKLTTFCGSPLYASPEIVSGTPYTGPEVDSWSLGVLLYALVYGTMPFDGSNYSLLSRKITQGDYLKQPVQSNAHSLIDWLLQVNPSKRATIDQVYHHKWLAACRQPKSILKNQECRQKRPPMPDSAELDGQLAKVCGVHNARDSLKLKNNQQLHHSIVTSLMHAKGGRRVLKKRDHRESGYYSSPERADSSSSSNSSSNKSPTCRNDKEVKMRHNSGQLQIPSLERLQAPSKGNQSQRPNSAYSDSSILSSEDSFNLCQFAVSSQQPPVSTSSQYQVQPSRPVSMPILHESQQPLMRSPRPGTLSPESEQLLRGLERILMPRQHLKSAPSTFEVEEPMSYYQQAGNYYNQHQYSPQVYNFNYNPHHVFQFQNYNFPQQQNLYQGGNRASSTQTCTVASNLQQTCHSQPESKTPHPVASSADSQPESSAEKQVWKNNEQQQLYKNVSNNVVTADV